MCGIIYLSIKTGILESNVHLISVAMCIFSDCVSHIYVGFLSNISHHKHSSNFYIIDSTQTISH